MKLLFSTITLTILLTSCTGGWRYHCSWFFGKDCYKSMEGKAPEDDPYMGGKEYEPIPEKNEE